MSKNYENFTLTVLIAKHSRVKFEGGGGEPPPPKIIGLKLCVSSIYIRKAYIPNLRPLGPLLHVEKFVWVVVGGWWWVVCKVILVFRFGPNLGLKTEDLGQAEQ